MVLFACSILGPAMRADELQVDLNSSDARRDAFTPHWENWAPHAGDSASKTFGDVTVTLKATPAGTLAPVLFKGSLDYGATMSADGIAVKNPSNGAGNGIDMIISGLAPGNHAIGTFHNEVRDRISPGALDVYVGNELQVKSFDADASRHERLRCGQCIPYGQC